AFYSSSFSRDTLHALLTAFGLGAGLIFVTGTIMGTIERWPIVSPAFLQQFSTSIIDRLFASGWLVWTVPPSCFAFLLLRYSYLHYRTIDRQRVWPKVPLVFLPGIVLLVILVS